MESDKCARCKTEFVVADAIRTPIELPCEHEVCAKCYLPLFQELRGILNEQGKLACLVCGEQFKLKKGPAFILSEA